LRSIRKCSARPRGRIGFARNALSGIKSLKRTERRSRDPPHGERGESGGAVNAEGLFSPGATDSNFAESAGRETGSLITVSGRPDLEQIRKTVSE